MNNGTIPLKIALKILGNNGGIITTPFSYVATTATIVWENCKPVFVDMHPDNLKINEIKIEVPIKEKTTCILATHVFDNPYNIEAIQANAMKYNLNVIYDAADCFGITYKEKSIFEYEILVFVVCMLPNYFIPVKVVQYLLKTLSPFINVSTHSPSVILAF